MTQWQAEGNTQTNPAPGRQQRASRLFRLAVRFALVACFLALLNDSPALAEDAACSIAFHRKALTMAIDHAPNDLRNSIRVQKTPMLQRVAEIHNSPSLVGDYRTLYDSIVTLAKERNRRAYPKMASQLTDISFLILMQYRPAGLDAGCATSDLNQQASFLYDGFDVQPDYADPAFAFDRPGEGGAGGDPSMLKAFNFIVNETLDLWTAIWNAAGRVATDLPETLTLVRGPGNPPYLSFMPLEKARALSRKVLAAGDYESAVEILTEIFSVEPNDRRTIYELALAQYQTKRFDDSLSNFSRIPQMRDAPFYLGMLIHRKADQSPSVEEQRKDYYDSFRLLNSVHRTGGKHRAEAEEMLRETAEHLVELYTAKLSDEISDAKRQLELAQLSKSATHRKEFEAMFAAIQTAAEEYAFVRATSVELALVANTPKDFTDKLAGLSKDRVKLKARAEKPRKAKPVKVKTPTVKKKPEPKPISPPKRTAKIAPAVPLPKGSPAVTPAVVAAAVPDGRPRTENRYKKFYAYVKGKEMAPVIDAFKSGYNGKACDQVKSRYQNEFKAAAGKADLSYWAERQQAYCLSGKLEKAAGTKYYAALSEFLSSIEPR